MAQIHEGEDVGLIDQLVVLADVPLAGGSANGIGVTAS